MRLEFGNTEHIKLAEKGILCECDHPKSEHGTYGGGCCATVDDEVEDCECTTCGDVHETHPMCECDEFTLKK